MVGFRIRFADGKYLGVINERICRTGIENAYPYHTVINATSVIKFLFKYNDITKEDNPVIIDRNGNIVEDAFL